MRILLKSEAFPKFLTSYFNNSIQGGYSKGLTTSIKLSKWAATITVEVEAKDPTVPELNTLVARSGGNSKSEDGRRVGGEMAEKGPQYPGKCRNTQELAKVGYSPSGWKYFNILTTSTAVPVCTSWLSALTESISSYKIKEKCAIGCYFQKHGL